MSEWYEHQKSSSNSVWLYSERGLMSYLFCHLMADNLEFILDHARDRAGVTLRQEIGDVQSHTTLTEYELGPQGFGAPDGSFLTAGSERRCFVFVEAKQRSYIDSCMKPDLKTAEGLSVPDLDIDRVCGENKFNSCINGQLELRWRFSNAVRASLDADDHIISERHVRVLPEDILAGDRFYWRLFLRPDRNVREHWRRVDMSSDLACLHRRLKEVYDDEQRMGRNGFYLLSITSDGEAPDFPGSLRLYDRNGNRLTHERRVFWLDRRTIEASLKRV